MPLIPIKSQVILSNKDLLTTVDHCINEGSIKASDVVDHFSSSSLEEILLAAFKTLPKDKVYFIAINAIEDILISNSLEDSTLENIRRNLSKCSLDRLLDLGWKNKILKNQEDRLIETTDKASSVTDMLERILSKVSDGALAEYVKERRLPKEFIKVLLDLL